ncbi:MAG: hypothetical protein J0M17_08870 [Planctomycetes bacterium]|nr:hypothetical protein [Planctomycetota bacterium]
MNGSHDFAALRRKLTAAAARRRRVRLLDALLLTAGLAAALVYLHYRIDRAWNLVPAARLVLDLLLVCGIGAAAILLVRPVLRRREDAVDVALRTAQPAAGGDLVAALQFDEWLRTGEAARYGSVGLLEAVVEQTTIESETFDPAQEPVQRPAGWKRGLAAAAVAALVVGAAFTPRHYAAWVDRALLGGSAYPSRTQIRMVEVNGHAVNFAGDGTPRVVVAENRPVRYEVVAAGELPESVRLTLVDEQGTAALLELTAADPAAEERSDDSGSRRYRIENPAPPLPVVVEAHAGDAFGEPFELIVQPLPRVMVSLEVTPPAYAVGADLPAPPPGRLSADVLEGSRVDVRVACANKSLRQAWLSAAEQKWPLRTLDAQRREWEFDPSGTPLESVVEPLEFSVEAVDDDGFAPAEILRGSILLRADQPPTIAAEVVTKYVLPTGKPSLLYQAADDIGVQSLAVLRQVLHGDGSTTQDRVEIPLPAAAATARRQLAGKFPLELAGLQLQKGDRVTVRLEARDRNGDPDRATAQSEPFTLEVTDEQGLYEAMAETDQRSARKMDEIIQKQLLMTGRGGATTGSSPNPSPPVAPLLPNPAPTPTAAPTATVPPAPTATPSASPASSPAATGSKP